VSSKIISAPKWPFTEKLLDLLDMEFNLVVDNERQRNYIKNSMVQFVDDPDFIGHIIITEGESTSIIEKARV